MGFLTVLHAAINLHDAHTYHADVLAFQSCRVSESDHHFSVVFGIRNIAWAADAAIAHTSSAAVVRAMTARGLLIKATVRN